MKERLLSVVSHIVDLPPGADGRRSVLLADRQQLEAKRKELEAAIGSGSSGSSAHSPFSSPAVQPAATSVPPAQQQWSNSAAASHAAPSAACPPSQRPPSADASGVFRDVTNSSSHAAFGSSGPLPGGGSGFGNASGSGFGNASGDMGFAASSGPPDGLGPQPDASLRSAAAGVSVESVDCRCGCCSQWTSANVLFCGLNCSKRVVLWSQPKCERQMLCQ